MTKEEIEVMEAEQRVESETGFSRWKWFAMMEKLADGDITRFEEVSKQSFILCLELLSYWKERDAYREQMTKQ